MIKRVLDLILATAALVVLSPVMGMVALGVRLVLGRPVLFRQSRPGKGEVPFVLYKFRTMREARSSKGEPLPDAERLMRFGRFLRATSLDELPSLINVVTGDMSLVGPRPLLMHYLPHYTPEQRRRHQVRPGITGLAQVRGRNALSWEEQFELDVWYVDNPSLLLDLKILLLSVPRVLGGRDISHPGSVTMEPFVPLPGDRGENEAPERL